MRKVSRKIGKSESISRIFPGQKKSRTFPGFPGIPGHVATLPRGKYSVPPQYPLLVVKIRFLCWTFLMLQTMGKTAGVGGFHSVESLRMIYAPTLPAGLGQCPGGGGGEAPRILGNFIFNIAYFNAECFPF